MKTKKLLVFILALILFVEMFYSVEYISTHSKHQCTGEECATCKQLEIAGAILHLISSSIIMAVAIYIYLCTINNNSIYDNKNIVTNTPIVLKVRLNN